MIKIQSNFFRGGGTMTLGMAVLRPGFLILLLCLPHPADAGLILQDQADAFGIVAAPNVKGQSFTAEDARIVSIGIGLTVLNPSSAYDTSLTMSLYSGIGMNGPLLGSQTIKPSAAGPGSTRVWVDFNFSGYTFQPGNVYSISYTAPTDYWGGAYYAWLAEHGQDYAGGMFFTDRNFEPYVDLQFRVVPVPEPRVAALASLALLMTAVFFWNRSRAKRQKILFVPRVSLFTAMA